MKKRFTELNAWQKAVLLSLLGLAIVVTGFFSGLLAPAENFVLDRYLRGAKPVQNHEKIVLVMGTDKTLETIRNWPWPSSVYAELIIAVSGAKTIVLCDEFLPTDTPVFDLKLVASMQQHGNVVLRGTYLAESNTFLRPRQALERNAAGMGLYQDTAGTDDVVRSYRVNITDDAGNEYPSLAYAVLQQSGYGLLVDDEHTLRISRPDGTPLHTLPLDADNAYWVPGIAQDGYEVYEMIDVLEGRVPANVFEGALVFVGSSVSLEHDLIATAHGEEHATVLAAQSVNAVLAGFSPAAVSQWVLVLLVVVLFAVCALCTLALPAAVGFLVPAALSAVLFFISRQLFVGGVAYLPVAGLLIWCWVAYLFTIFLRYMAMSTIVDHTTIPLQQTFAPEIEEDTDGKERFVRHVESLQGLIESTGLSLQEPLVTNEHEFVKEHRDKLAAAGHEQDSYVVVKNPGREKPRYRLLIPHPKADPEEPDEYTLLCANNVKSPYAVQSIVSLIRNAALYFKALQYGEERHRLSFNIVKCMVAAMDAKDPITSGHSQRVAKISLQIAEKMDFTPRELEELELAAIVHDIGKIGIQDHVLNKKGIFSSDEFKEMQTHPMKGISIMSPSGLSQNTSDAILNHHERPDGRGYPAGKSRDEVGLFAKIVKISDVYDALLGERQYKKAWPLEKVCDLLYLGRGNEFDAEITDLFLEMIKPEGWMPPSAPGGGPRSAVGPYGEYVEYGEKSIETAWRLLQHAPDKIPSFAQEPELEHANRFLGLEWGEALDEIEFMLRRPYLLKYDPGRDFYCFALELQGQNGGFAVFQFLHKYLTSGALFLPASMQAETVLTEAFGRPALQREESLLWDVGKVFILLRHSAAPGQDAVAFVTKYEFGEKDQ